MVWVKTADAAQLVGVKPASFRQWARRRHLEPVQQIKGGRHTTAVWEADEVLEAQARRPSYERG